MLQTTRLSKAVSALLLVLYLVQLFVPDSVSYLALVPGRTLPCVWNLVTAGLLTINPVELVLSIAALLVLARLVEPVYGSKEFLRFIFIINLLTSCTVFVAVYIAYATGLTGRTGAVLYAKFTGFHGIIAGLLVALKQVMPHHELKVFGSFKLRVKYLPSALLPAVALVAFVLNRLDYLAFYVSGTYLSWLYLRFFQLQPDSQQQGDASEDFKFSSFFPEPLAVIIDPLATALGFITRLRHAPGHETTLKGFHTAAGVPSVLGSDTADASRRRERGAKALEERLGLKAGGLSSSSGNAAAAAPVSPPGSPGDVEAGQGATAK